MYRPVPPRIDLPAMERDIIAWWAEHDIFDRSLEQSAGKPSGCSTRVRPTANGTPGTHHVEARVFKDVFPRFKTMQGYHVPRKAGWDCHGLPVELAVEKQLGFSGKKDIEAYGIEAFNAQCRESVLRARRRVRGDDPADGLLGRPGLRLLDDDARPTSRACGGR